MLEQERRVTRKGRWREGGVPVEANRVVDGAPRQHREECRVGCWRRSAREQRQIPQGLALIVRQSQYTSAFPLNSSR